VAGIAVQSPSTTRFAPSDLEQTLSAGRMALITAPRAPEPSVYAPAHLQSGQPSQQMAQPPAYGNAAPLNGQQNGQPPAFPNPYAYNNAPQYNRQPNGYGNQQTAPGYGNGYSNGFPGGFNSVPGGFGGLPSFGGFPSMGSPNTNFSPFGFW